MIIYKVLAVNRIYLKKNVGSTKIDRECTGIAIKTKGATKYKQNEKEIISDRNHILVLPKGSSYEYTCLEEGSCFIIEFDTPFLNENNILSIPVTNIDEFISLFTRIEHTLNFNEVGKNAFLLADAYRVLTKLIDQITKDYLPNSSNILLMPALTYIEENLSSPAPTNEFLASLCSISCVYFRKLFVKKFGMPPSKYITMLKIQKAKGLIISDFISFADIADTCGFTSIYHFSKVFEKETGLTPTEYKRKK
jgi:AraC-like DNA-binding protein